MLSNIDVLVMKVILSINTKTREIYYLIGNDGKVNSSRIEEFNQNVDLFLGHRRFAIFDPSPLGHQPMSNKDRTIWMLYNGEVYNYI